MKLSLRPVAAVLLASSALLAPALAFAQAPPLGFQQPTPAPATRAPANAAALAVTQGVRVDRITVRGNERIETSTIISYTPIQLGTLVTGEQINVAIQSLTDLGLFANVDIQVINSEMIITVDENPIINRVIFEGEQALKEDKLVDEVTARARGVFTRTRIQQDVQRLIEVYRLSGRISANITPKIVELSQKRVDVIFEIDEGPKSGILDVNFLGNETYSDNDLRDVIVTEPTRWYKFFSNNANYDPDRIDYDESQLRDFYRNRGYYDFRVVSSTAELRPDRNGFAITFTVDEGKPYTFGNVKVTTELNSLDGEVLQRLLPIQKGAPYSDTAIENARDALTFAAGSAGFAFVDIIPEPSADTDTGVVDVEFRITEGPRVYVERIDVIGNTTTLDRVIRRELEMVEGDAFRRDLIVRSENNLRGLNFFETSPGPEIEELPGSAPDKAVLRVNVTEKQTGELAFSAGYSSVDSLVLTASMTEINWRGRGQVVRADIRTGSYQNRVTLGFTEPKFRGRNLSVGADLFSYSFDLTRQANYETTQTGGNLRLGFPLSQNSFLNLQYSLRTDDITVRETACIIANPALCSQQGSEITSAVSATWSLNRTNDSRRPTRGYAAAITQDFSGLGGDTKYIRTQIDTSWYHGFTPSLTLSVKGSGGYVDSYGGTPLRISDRFFKGGQTFRGFETAGIGPRDTVFNSSLGGKIYGIGTVELTIPTFLPQQFGIDATLFTDFGTMGGIDRLDKIQCDTGTPPTCGVSASVKDDFAFRASAGITIGWNSPLGPIQFDISKVLSKADYDRTESFKFSQRTSF